LRAERGYTVGPMWRGLSIRSIALLLFGPLMIDLLMTCFLFEMEVSAVRMKYPPHTQMFISALMALGYISGAHVAGMWMTPARAKRCILAVAPLLVGLGSVAMAMPNFWVYLCMALLMGLVISHYYVPFQIMMGDIRPFRTLAWTVAFYNISWGTGFACGPLMAGYLKEISGNAVLWGTLTVALLHVVIATAAHFAPKRGGEETHTFVAFSSTPRMRWMSILGVGACLMVVMGFRETIWPGVGVPRGFPDKDIALGAALLSAPTPILALLWAKYRRLFFKPWLMVGSLVLAAAAAGMLGFARSYAESATCLAVLGSAISCLYFYGIYYANADPVDAHKSVSRYESMVGAAGILGPTVLGSVAWHDAEAMRVYVLCAALLAAAAIGVYVIREKPAPDDQGI